MKEKGKTTVVVFTGEKSEKKELTQPELKKFFAEFFGVPIVPVKIPLTSHPDSVN